MTIDIQIPSLVFSATSLLMLSYTNRFLTLAGLVRDLIESHKTTKDSLILMQIENLQKRMIYIRKMQLWGAASFAFAILSTFIQLFDNLSNRIAVWIFVFSLISIFISILYLIQELSISNEALMYQLETIRKEKE